MKKKLIINILFLILVLIFIEALNFYSYKNRYKDLVDAQAHTCKDVQQCKKELATRYTKPRIFNYYEWIRQCLSRVYIGTKKGGIVTIGCSYTFGVGLDEDQTFAYKLNKYTNRTTYNRGVSGSGPQMVYRQISDNNFKNEVPDAEYFIYTFLFNHTSRQFQTLLDFHLTDIDLNYKIKNDKLEEISHPYYFLYSLFTIKNILENIKTIKSRNEYENNFPLFFKTMEETSKVIKEKYPNAKFILMEFPDAGMCNPEYTPGSSELTLQQINKLEKLGIMYLNAEQLVGHNFRNIDKYRVADKDHPNEEVWDEIVPALVKKLQL